MLDPPELLHVSTFNHTRFLNWTENGLVVSGSAIYSFTVSADRTLVANFLPASYSTWKSGSFTPAQLGDPSVSGNLANPSGDGICNLLDYAFGLSPAVHNSPSALPQASVTADGHLALTYPFNKYAGDLTYIVEVSDDLQTWNSGTGFTSAPVVLGDNGSIQTLQATDLTSLSSKVKRFIRLRVAAH